MSRPGSFLASAEGYVIRLKESWKPKVDVIAAGDVARTFLPGADFDALLDDEVLRLTGPSIDADVRLGRADGGVPSRLVGVQHDGSYRYYLTNLPRDVSTPQCLIRTAGRYALPFPSPT